MIVFHDYLWIQTPLRTKWRNSSLFENLFVDMCTLFQKDLNHAIAKLEYAKKVLLAEQS